MFLLFYSYHIPPADVLPFVLHSEHESKRQMTEKIRRATTVEENRSQNEIWSELEANLDGFQSRIIKATYLLG